MREFCKTGNVAGNAGRNGIWKYDFVNEQHGKEVRPMEQVMKHYGNAILVIIVLLALGAILVAALTSDGYVATAFKEALTGFFGRMSALAGT